MRFTTRVNNLLKYVRNNEFYLLQEHNLPQLAKILYFHCRLHQVGRACFGFEGIVEKKMWFTYSVSSVMDGLDEATYAASCLHLKEGEPVIENYDYFLSLLNCNYQYNELELLYNKPKKDCEDWIAYFTHKDYICSYESRISAIISIMAGYGVFIKDGVVGKFICGINRDLFLGWENAKLGSNIERMITDLILDTNVQTWINLAHKQAADWHYEHHVKPVEDRKQFEEHLKSKGEETVWPETKQKPRFARIRLDSSLITNFYKLNNSYQKVAIEYLEWILSNQDINHNEDIDYANKYLQDYKKHYDNR